MSTIELLHQLVGFDTSNHAGIRSALNYCAAYLDSCGIASRLVPTIDGKSASLIATIGDPQQQGGIALMANLDTPVAEHSQWALDPFVLQEHNGLLSALGVSNMKGFIAALLAFAPDMQQRRLPTPIHIVLTHNHETVECSMTSLIQQFATENMGVSSVIMGNPTSMRVALSHKGHSLMSTRVRGASVNVAHNHKGVNAVWFAAHLIDYLEKIQGESKNFLSDVKELDPPWTSVNVGNFSSAGTADSIAGFASFDWEVRTIPEMKVSEIINQFTRYSEAMTRELQEVAPRVAVETMQLRRQPAFRVDVDSKASTLAALVSKKDPVPAVSFVTPAPVLQSAGISVAICGPGDIQYAGTPRESISMSELNEVREFVFRLMDRLETDHDESTGHQASA